MELNFANRDDELPVLTEFLRPGGEPAPAAVCIVSGPSGVGKSRLVDQAARMAGTAAPYVRVPIRVWDPEAGESGFFLRMCALAVSEASGTHGYTALNSFGQRRGALATARAAATGGAKGLEKVLTGTQAAVPAIDAWTAQQDAVRDLLGQPSTEALKAASDYLRRVAGANGLALAVENAQNLDRESLHYLLALIERSPMARLVLEYTSAHDPAAAGWPYTDLVAACRSSRVTVLELPVPVVSFDALAAQNFSGLDGRFVETLRHVLKKEAGNIREVERLHEISEMALTPSVSSTDTVARFVSALTDEQKIVLWFIVLHRREIDPYELSEMSRFVPPQLRPAGPVAAAQSLKPFVHQKEGLFAVDHDSLYRRLQSIDCTRRHLLVAAEALSAYFQAFLEKSDFSRYSEYEILFALLFLGTLLASPALVDLAVDRLSARVFAKGRPAGLLRRVQEFIASTSEDELHVETVKRLIGILYDSCWLEGSLELTKRFKDKAVEIRLCHCQSLALGGFHSQAAAELTRLEETLRLRGRSNANNRLLAYVGLMRALIARVAGDYDGARRHYGRLSPSMFPLPRDRCVFYRFSEVAGADDSTESLLKAREIAKDLPDKTDLGRANLSLCIPYVETGEPEKALELIAEAESLGLPSYVDDYMIANNRLAAELLAGRDVERSYRTLQEKLPLIIDSMDRALAMNNLLAAAVRVGDGFGSHRCRTMVEDFLSSIIEPNIRRISLYNCSRAYACDGLDRVAADYASQAFSIPVRFDDAYWAARKSGSRDRKLDFRLSADFDVPVMTNWYFRWPDFAATLE